MAGHSQFKNIMYRKGAQDAKRAKLFTKVAREISAAVRSGLPDPASNPRLRAAIAVGRKANMPRDRIEMAIKKGSGELGGEHYDEVRYEGYAPGGVALIVEALTDNRNRTAAEIRSAFSKHAGNLGETGSVNFQFDRIGLLLFPSSVASADAMFEAAVEAGAENVESGDTFHEIHCTQESFAEVRDSLSAKFGDPETARLHWQPKMTVEIADVTQAETILKLVETLEDNDDVQYVCGNYVIADAIADKLT